MAAQAPFQFLLDLLESARPRVKAMFGGFAVYLGPQIIFILYQRDAHPRDNGVWLATTGEHHASLQKLFPSMRSLELFGPGPTGWQLLPVDAPDFEESVTLACELVLARDPRIGKTPKAKRKSTRKEDK